MLENNCDTKQQFVVYLGEVFFFEDHHYLFTDDNASFGKR